MLVSIKSSGGFAGIERTLGAIDSRSLPEPTALRLSQCIDQLFSISRSTVQVGADFLVYEFTVAREPGGPATRFMISDDGAPTRPPMNLVNEVLGLLGR